VNPLEQYEIFVLGGQNWEIRSRTNTAKNLLSKIEEVNKEERITVYTTGDGWLYKRAKNPDYIKYIKEIFTKPYDLKTCVIGLPARDTLFEIGVVGSLYKQNSEGLYVVITDDNHANRIRSSILEPIKLKDKIKVIETGYNPGLTDKIKEFIVAYATKKDLSEFNVDDPKLLLAFSLSMPWYKEFREGELKEYYSSLIKDFPEVVKESKHFERFLEKSNYYKLAENISRYGKKGLINYLIWNLKK